MNRENFNNVMAAFANVFPNSEKFTPEAHEIYFEALSEIPEDIWRKGALECMRTLTFFPTIHDIGVACFGERKEEWVDRCDPLRERQNYREKVAAIPWQQNMATVLQQCGLPSPERVMIEGPEGQVIKREENVRLRQALEEIEKLKADKKELLDDRWSLLQENRRLRAQMEKPPHPKPTIEERKGALKEQARFLLENEQTKESAAPSAD